MANRNSTRPAQGQPRKPRADKAHSPKPAARKADTPQAGLRNEIEVERRKIFKAMGILDCIASAQDRCNIAIGEPDIAYAAEAAHDLLNDVAGRLDGIASAREVRS